MDGGESAIGSDMNESLAAVVSHGLLNSLGVVAGGMYTLGRAWERLPDERRAELGELALSQADVMADAVEALPPTARHRVSNNLFVIRGVCQTVLSDGRHLDESDRARLFDVVARQSAQATEVLQHVVRALPDDVLELLDRLDDDRSDRLAG